MKTIFKKLLFLVSVLALLSCSGKNLDDPFANIPDPEGTIKISLRNSGYSSIEGIHVTSANNFEGADWRFVSVGKVRGLGNISKIPLQGWSRSMAVIPGEGYIAANEMTQEYIAIYIDDYILDSVNQGVIGFSVKYVRNHKGCDQMITLSENKLTISPSGTPQLAYFTNDCIIPCNITVYENWCHVKRVWTANGPGNAIEIYCDESSSIESQTAEIVLTTLYGKKTKLNVTREEAERFLTLTGSSDPLNCSNLTQDFWISIKTNIPENEIHFKSSENWITVKGFIIPEYEEDPLVKSIEINVAPYLGSTYRKGQVNITAGNIEQTVEISQRGNEYSFSPAEVTIGSEGEIISVGFWCLNHWIAGVAEFKYDIPTGSEWCKIVMTKPGSYPHGNNIQISADANNSTEARSTTITLTCELDGIIYEVGTIPVKQLGKQQ